MHPLLDPAGELRKTPPAAGRFEIEMTTRHALVLRIADALLKKGRFAAVAWPLHQQRALNAPSREHTFELIELFRTVSQSSPKIVGRWQPVDHAFRPRSRFNGG